MAYEAPGRHDVQTTHCSSLQRAVFIHDVVGGLDFWRICRFFFWRHICRYAN